MAPSPKAEPGLDDLVRLAVDHMSDGFALWDENDRLVFCNEKYRKVCGSVADLAVPGVGFEELLRAYIGREEGPWMGPGGEKWLAERMALHRNPKGPFEVARAAGWFRFHEIRLPDGQTVIFVADLTEIKNRENELAEARRNVEANLQAAVEGISDGFALLDAEDKFVLWNRAYAREMDLQQILYKGLPFEDCVRLLASRLFYGNSSDRIEEMVRERMEIHRQHESFEYRMADGRWFLMKDYPTAQGGSALVRIDITETRQAEENLRKLSTAVAHSPAGILIADSEGRVEYANRRAEEITEYSAEELIGRIPRPFREGDLPPAELAQLWAHVRSGKTWSATQQFKRKSGEIYWSEVAVAPVMDRRNEAVNLIGILQDVTEKKRTEERLRHAQKMEAIGLLAGGIAHDFNNILAGILGYCQVVISDMGAASPHRNDMEQIKTASLRARDLIAQMLAFSRQKESARRPIELPKVVEEILLLARASTPASIALETKFHAGRGTVTADPTQIHQTLMNLLSNARDAIVAASGRIVIEVAEETVDRPRDLFRDRLQAGRYIRLSVSDSGTGIEPAVLDRIFDPFFTTKDVGKGTGLGLAAVHGIVKDHDGFIDVITQPGAGTCFSLYFPRTDAAPSAPQTSAPSLPRGTERVLLVDDEEMVANTAGRMLKRLGYDVTICRNPAEALELGKSADRPFDILVTDLTMPGITGEELMREIRRAHPGLPAILCTGNLMAAGTEEFSAILKKPYELTDIAALVREVLDRVRR